MRQRNETIPELAQNIRKLTRQAYPGANSDLIDTLALDHFIDTLLDAETRLRLRECSPKTIQEAKTLAVKLEAQRLADWQRSKNVGSLSETSEDRNFSNDMRKLSETVKGLVESVEYLQKKREPTDFHPGNEHGNSTNSPNSYRSQRPNQNFDNRNRSRNSNWPRNRAHKMVPMTQIWQGHLIDGISMTGQWDSRMLRSGLYNRKTRTGQVWGSQLDHGECEIRSGTA